MGENEIMKKLLVIIVVSIIAVSAVMSLSQSVSFAQSTTKPSAPQFTIQVISGSSLQFVIENQDFISSSSVNAIMYYYRVKDNCGDQWMIDRNGQLQSDSETTVIAIPSYPSEYLFGHPSHPLSNVSVLDFQLQAETGFYLEKYVQGQMPGALLETDGYWETTFNKSETSDWSSTQTVNLSEYATIPEFPSWTILLTTLVAGVAVTIFFRDRLKKQRRFDGF
jgi:uncharacterized membrane protein YwzB